jgi:hypothetical protein
MEIVMIRNWAANVANQGVALIASLLMRSAIKPLLEIDERSLLAVGLSRADLIECLSTPFTADPTELLVRAAERRGHAEASEGCREQVCDAGADPQRGFSRTHQLYQSDLRSFPCPG